MFPTERHHKQNHKVLDRYLECVRIYCSSRNVLQKFDYEHYSQEYVYRSYLARVTPRYETPWKMGNNRYCTQGFTCCAFVRLVLPRGCLVLEIEYGSAAIAVTAQTGWPTPLLHVRIDDVVMKTWP